MDQGRISASYAKALLQWASPLNLAHEVYEQSICLLKLMDSNPDFYLLLHSPMASLSQKIKAVTKVLNSCSPKLADFVCLMVKNRRERHLKNAILVYHVLYRQNYNITKATVESAKEMNTSSKQQIEDFLKTRFGGEIDLEFKLKPEIIGGFILTIDDLLLDKSVRGEIEKLRRKLIGIEN
jgi:F-type H+-transporting ATPase subunit delta